MIKFYDRKTKQINIEDVAGSKSLSLIYSNPIGKKFLPNLASKKVFSSIYGWLCDTKSSKKFIQKFITNFNINMNDYEKSVEEFTSFNDFFYRKLSKGSRPCDMNASHFISPCDSRLLAIDHIDEDSKFNLKGYTYSLNDLVQDKAISDTYKNGTCLIFRLCPTDYHRFHFIDSGKVSDITAISGRYYSVNPIALETIENLFAENKREYCIQHSDNFDDLLYIDIGATFVGSIIQTYEPNTVVGRGDEKGYFKFGGSTVVVFIKEGILKLDDDILEHSRQGIETLVKMGEKIGVRA